MDAIVSYRDFPSHKRVHCSKHSSSWRPFMALIMEVWSGGWRKGHFWEMTRWRRVVKLWVFWRFLDKWKVSWYYYVTMIHYLYMYTCSGIEYIVLTIPQKTVHKKNMNSETERYCQISAPQTSMCCIHSLQGQAATWQKLRLMKGSDFLYRHSSNRINRPIWSNF